MPSKDSWGGPAACEPPFADALARLGVEVVTEDYVFGDKERPTPIFSRVGRVLRTALRVRRLLRQDKYDILFLNSALDTKTLLRDCASLLIMQPRPARVFLKVHGSMAQEFIGRGGLWHLLINYLRKRVDAFGVHTRDELGAFLALGFSSSRFFRVRNAITIADVLPVDYSREQKPSTGHIQMLFVARFVRTKGLMATIRACALLKQKGVDVSLLCVGDGEVKGRAEELVKELGVAQQVTFTGYIPEDDVTKLFLSSDIFVFPTSHAEGFPVVLFKAVATGMPIVTTTVRAAGEYLMEPDNCLFCSSEPDDIAEQISKLIDDESLRHSMSVANLAYGETLLPDTIAAEYLEIFNSMLDGVKSKHTFDQ